MKDSKLVRLFMTLERNELNSFVRQWEKRQKYEGINGAYLYRLFDYLKHNRNKEHRLKREIVSASVYENQAYDARKLNELNTIAYKKLEQYVIELQLEYEEKDNPIQKRMILIRYMKRQLAHAAKKRDADAGGFGIYYNEIENLYRKVLETPKKDIFSYLDVYILSHLLYYNVDTDSFKHGQLIMEGLLEALDKFLYLAKLKYGAEVIARQRIKAEKVDMKLIEEIRNVGHRINTDKGPLIKIYEQYYDLLSHEKYQEADFVALRDFTFECVAEVSSNEITDAIGLLLNYAVWALRYKQPVAPAIYEIYRFGFANDLFTDEGLIHPQLLINYCFCCAKLDRYYEIPAILQKHLEKVKEDKKTITGMLCLAYRDFGARKYKAVFSKLLSPGPVVFAFFFAYRSLKIMSLYEIEEYIGEDGKYYEPTQEITNFMRSLEERNVSEFIKESNRNFGDFLMALHSYKFTKEQLEAMLEAYETIAYYDWLRSKLNEYKP